MLRRATTTATHGFSAPFKSFKRYSNYAGGTNDPLVMSWPAGITEGGEIRHQYHHSVDIVPTILEITGLEMPAEANGVEQHPLAGVSMAYTFDAEADIRCAIYILRDANEAGAAQGD